MDGSTINRARTTDASAGDQTSHWSRCCPHPAGAYAYLLAASPGVALHVPHGGARPPGGRLLVAARARRRGSAVSCECARCSTTRSNGRPGTCGSRCSSGAERPRTGGPSTRSSPALPTASWRRSSPRTGSPPSPAVVRAGCSDCTSAATTQWTAMAIGFALGGPHPAGRRIEKKDEMARTARHHGNHIAPARPVRLPETDPAGPPA